MFHQLDFRLQNSDVETRGEIVNSSAYLSGICEGPGGPNSALSLNSVGKHAKCCEEQKQRRNRVMSLCRGIGGDTVFRKSSGSQKTKAGGESEKSLNKLISRNLLSFIILQVALLSYFVDYANAQSVFQQFSDEYAGHVHRSIQPEAWTTRSQIIDPQLSHGIHKRSIDSTLEDEGLHVSQLTVTFRKEDGESVVLDLQLNKHLLPSGHFIHYQLPGRTGYARKNFTRHDVDHCHYVGKIRDNEDSSAAISTCDNAIDGVVFDGADTYYIHSDKNGSIGVNHYLIKHSDVDDWTNKTCGYKGTKESLRLDRAAHHASEFNRILRYKRDAEESMIRGPFNANKESSYVEMILVVDNKVYKGLGENLKLVHRHCKTISNIINALYMPLNIYIALIGVVVWNDINEVELSSDGDKTLKNFLTYRRKTLAKEFPNDNAQLLTREQFDGGVVGKALKGPICTYEFSGGVSMDHSQIIAVVATTVAHELGHNFGMEHDTADCKCPDDRCIMSASSSSIAPKHWSSCSIDQLNLAFHQGMNYCLKNKPAFLFDSPQCGNGFVEPGEQCDCGLPEFCENSCCDPFTCMLYSNASCATGACCDLNTCRPKNVGTICRDSYGECDLPEFCSGESEYCPKDVFKRDTEECNDGKAYCYQGSCRSRTDQCKVLWGISGNSSDECYTKNEEGTRHGNCGYDRMANEYIKCNTEDVYCGMLHCRHTNEKLEFGLENVAVLSHSFLNHENRIVVCRTAIIDLGLQSIDPGLAPDGAKCGENKMCLNQKCRSLDSIMMTREGGKAMGLMCPNNCNGRGTCNSEGHCHCNNGFAPPDCNDPGPGGSIDSGPATNPNAGAGFVKFMYIVFLGVIPLVALLVLLFYYCRNNGVKAIFKRPIHVPKQILKQSPSKHSPSSGNSSSALSHVKSTPSSPDDINTSLLRNNEDPVILNGNMFGKFKGFTLKPLQELTNSNNANNFNGSNIAYVTPVTKSPPQEEPVVEPKSPIRSAPPVPKILIGRSQSNQIKNTTNQKPVAKISRAGTTVNEKVSKFENKTDPPALPPLNPGSNARPLISSPILESSTSNAKELMSPTKGGKQLVPGRPAPVSPPQQQKVDQIEVDFANKPLPPVAPSNKEKGSTLQRIKSFMKKEEKPNYERKVPKFIDRTRLKTIEISAPIPQMETQNEIHNRKSLLNRTQSMRNSAEIVEKAPELHTFGSMRLDGGKRPISIVNSRPKSPPPRPPAPPTTAPVPAPLVSNMKIPGLPSYQNPPPPKKVTIKTQDDYDDCDTTIGQAPLAHISEDSTPSSPPDNIYSVIDEDHIHDIGPAHDTSLESLGLLGEIVNEIDNINLDSIYSATTIKRQKSKEDDEPSSSAEHRYANTDDDDYGTNMRSNASTTSSGYLRPSAINMPVARIAPNQQVMGPDKQETNKNAFSSFKSGSNPVGTVKPLANGTPEPDKSKVQPKSTGYKPYHSSINRPTLSSQYSTPNSLANKKSNDSDKSKVVAPKLARTVTPPNLRTKPATASNQTAAASKLTETKAVKDVKPKPQTAIKPNVVKPPIAASSVTRADSKSNPTETKSSKLTNGIVPSSTVDNHSVASSKVLQKAAITNRQNGVSNVASLQKKFETDSTKK